jgi:hypothetical protein
MHNNTDEIHVVVMRVEGRTRNPLFNDAFIHVITGLAQAGKLQASFEASSS